VRSDRFHDCKFITLHSNLRWRWDGLEFTCWHGEIIWAAFIIGVHACEIIA
jgi:hypothetical protein